MKSTKRNWFLGINILLSVIAFNGKNTRQPEFVNTWDKVDLFIKNNWHTSKVDSNGASWLRRIGIVPPKPFMTIAKGNPLLFYWDNYFTNKGLLLIDSLSIYARNGVDNLLWEVDTLGFAPNANMNWGMNRSQPPFLAMMVYDVYQKKGDKDWLKNAYMILKKEYLFWTDTRSTSIENHSTSIPGLQRYDHHASQQELIELYASCYQRGLLKIHPDSISLNQKLEIAGNYTAEAATGMDFTPRFENRCTDFVAIDLNSNLYKYEEIFSWITVELGLKNEPDWKILAKKRKALIIKYCWNEKRGLFMDYDYKHNQFSSVASITCMYPLAMGIATKHQAEKTFNNLSLFEYKYGVTICEKKDKPVKYQWDYPAGWPPMYLITVQALKNYGYKKAALRVCEKYLDVVAKNFMDPSPKTFRKNESTTITRKPGFVYEKYNVVTGGINDLEYPANEFIGWSAGVYVWCYNFYKINK